MSFALPVQQIWVVLLVVSSLTATATAQDRAKIEGVPGWQTPSCSKVTGTTVVTLTRDDGATLLPNDGSPPFNSYTTGLVALQQPSTLYAVSNRALYRSTTAGCDWERLDDIPFGSGELIRLVASVGDRAFGYGGNDLIRLDGRTTTLLKSPGNSITGLIAHPAHSERARLADEKGAIWETTNGGQHWTQIGRPPVVDTGFILYHVAFDHNDDSHAVVSTSKGAFVTFDGGAAWTRSSGISSNADRREIVHISVISQHEGNVVWLEGTDGYSSNQIFRSTDGGRSFRSVVKATADVTITNGTSLWPKPATSDVLYFSYGTSFGDYGADIYRYDHAVQAVTKTHNAFTSIPALEFNPSNPTVMYLGVTLDGPRN